MPGIVIGARAPRRLLLAAVLGVLSLSLAAAANAAAAPGAVHITSPLNGSRINDAQPVFTGTTDFSVEELEHLGSEEAEEFPVTLKVFAGESSEARIEMSTAAFLGGSWSIGPVATLPPGVYKARAQQMGVESETVTFTVDTTPPQITLTSPPNGSTTASGSESLAGTAGSEPGDAQTVTINLFAGGAIGAQAPLEALGVAVSNGSWSATFGGLAPGTYTAQAAQSDQAGNTGTSAPVTFTVTGPPAVPLPAASFKWFPPAPKTGETVALVSSSTDSASPITGFAWALSSTAPFSAGNPVLTTSFATPGNHVVRLRVTDAGARSSTATQTIPVTGRPLVLMQPFPIVRIVGSVTAYGARLRLLTVQAPLGATVTVTCSGHHCKPRSERRVARTSAKNKSKVGAVTLSFRRFQRALRGGQILEIRVSKAGEIGKFTSFAIRRRKLPVRVDACLRPSSPKPIACPKS